MRSNSWYGAAARLATLAITAGTLLGCAESGVAPSRLIAPHTVQLALAIRIGGPAKALRLKISYRGGAGGAATTVLLDQTLDIGIEARAVPLAVDVGPCLADPQRESAPTSASGAPGCMLHIDATLLGTQSDVIDVSALPPIPVHQGENAQASLSIGTRSSFVSLALGADHTCRAFTTTGGGTICWGSNTFGQLSGGTPASPDFLHIVSGAYRTCGLTTAGVAYCWGQNPVSRGEGLADGSPGPIASPVAFAQLAAGSDFTCGVSAVGVAYCWGQNAHGALGDGTVQSHIAPAPVKGSIRFTRIVAGGNFACGVTTGPLYCWGSIDGSIPSAAQLAGGPVALAGTDVLHLASLAPGFSHACGLDVAGLAVCVGSNRSGQLGDGTVSDHPNSPVLVSGGLRFVALAAGTDFTCGIATDGAAYCWGVNASGQLGDGTTTNRAVPTRVNTTASFAALAAGANHACASTSGGAVYCWGSNAAGQLGDQTRVNRSVPVLATPARP